MLALARGGALADVRFYPNMVDELVGLVDGATPVWILASSIDSASYAAHLGLPLSWAYFIATTDGGPLLDAYRAQYRPSRWSPEPVSNIGVSVICGDTDADAERIASSVRLWRRVGLRGPIPSVEDALAAGVDRQLDVLPGRQPMVVGSPERCADALTAIADHHGVDEVLAVTICHRHDDRVRSYELLAKVFGLTA
jgi:alkanesulfonate monooxygenase SsuD/methylene tetrahydromethanopterin reductase-like flavin-dependent oxidoreductase (luciferase family)